MKRLGLVLLVGCASAATKENASSAKRESPEAGVGVPVDAAVALVDAAAPSLVAAPQPVTAFYPVVQGACPAARPVLIGSTPVLHFAKAAWAMPPDAPAKLLAQQPPPYYSQFVGTMVGDTWRIAALGGTDLDHVWYTIGSFSGRGEDQTELTLGKKTLETPHGQFGYYGIQHVIQQPDGSIWAYAQHGMYLDIPGDEKLRALGSDPTGAAWRYNRWFAWSKDGTPLDINLPMGDMELAQRLDSGELVTAAVTAQGALQLRRWSPTRKVNDLTTTDVVRSGLPELRVGKMRAVMKHKDKPVFYIYDGADKLAAAPVSAKAHGASSWVVTQSDELWITTSDGKLFIEAKDGTITEEKLPENGTLARETSTPWLMGSSGAVYERTGKEWHKLALPDGLWSDAPHPPDQVEWVSVLGAETWVGTVRTDKGFGSKNPTAVRTFYSSKPRATPLRCGSPFAASILSPLPPRPDASCKDFIVVLGRERGANGKVAIPYAKIAASLKGDAVLGDSLSLGVFGSDGAYGMHASTPEIAGAVAKKLAHVTSHEPELVCASSTFDEKRSATLDVKAGAFTSIPDAGAP
jgi:hypothetical protein